MKFNIGDIISYEQNAPSDYPFVLKIISIDGDYYITKVLKDLDHLKSARLKIGETHILGKYNERYFKVISTIQDERINKLKEI